MGNLLSAKDRKHLPSKVYKGEVNHLTVYDTCKCYEYWKKRLSEIEKELVHDKTFRSEIYKQFDKNSSSFVNQTKFQLKKDILYLRLLKQEIFQIYKEAKKIYLDFQKKYSQQIEAETPLWKNVHGKILHRITVINKSDNKVHTTYYVKLNEAHCSFSGFIRKR